MVLMHLTVISVFATRTEMPLVLVSAMMNGGMRIAVSTRVCAILNALTGVLVLLIQIVSTVLDIVNATQLLTAVCVNNGGLATTAHTTWVSVGTLVSDATDL